MKIVKPIIAILLLIPYVCSFGALSIEAHFPDGTSICYEGWSF